MSGEAPAPLPCLTQDPHSGALAGRKCLIPESTSCRNLLQVQLQLVGPSEPVDNRCSNSKPLLAQSQDDPKGCERRTSLRKTVCPAPVYMDTYRDAGAFSNHGICRLWASCFLFSPVMRVSYCSTTSHEGRGRISWLMCVKAIRGWHEAVTQSHTSTLISSCQTLSAYFWYRFCTCAHVTHSGPHPLQISAHDCI